MLQHGGGGNVCELWHRFKGRSGRPTVELSCLLRARVCVTWSLVLFFALVSFYFCSHAQVVCSFQQTGLGFGNAYDVYDELRGR